MLLLFFLLLLLCLSSFPGAAENDMTISRRLQFENMMELPIRVQTSPEKGTPARVRRNISTAETIVRRRLQFEGMMDLQPARGARRKKGVAGGGGGGASGKNRRKNRPQALAEAVEEIVNNADRYSQWWTGPLNEQTYSFKPAAWGAQHNPRLVMSHHALCTHYIDAEN